MRVLITGGAGFIGSHTADALLAAGHSVRALDILDPQIHGESRQRPAYLAPEVELQIGDVCNADDVARALDGIDGQVARMVRAESRFGAELDSLSDATATKLAMDNILDTAAARATPVVGSSPSKIGGESPQ